MNTNRLNKVYQTSKDARRVVVPEGEKLTEKNLQSMESWAADNLRSYGLLLQYKAITVEQHDEEVSKVRDLLNDIERLRKEGIDCSIIVG